MRRLESSTQRPGSESVTAPATCNAHRAVTVVCISDTHNTTPSPLPPGDILLHAGDLSQYGTFPEIQAQLSWLAAQPHPHKVVVAGNHDLLLDPVFVAAHPDRELDLRPGQRRDDLVWGDVRYLERESLDLPIQGTNRTVRLFGSPWTPRHGHWAFQYGKDSTPHPLGTAPSETDVILTHGPPKGYLDAAGGGCEMLLADVWRIRPKLLVCGHIHSGRGEEWLRYDGVDKWYGNVMLGRRPWLSIVCLALYYPWLLLATALRLGPPRDQTRGTHLVNAAVVGGRGNAERREAVVATI
ncbi:hypothetical protein RJ55_01246 [Drechmeria coniospora]|nr:hypothetical protein RJ55_01246 [Drechmeria coniospora]